MCQPLLEVRDVNVTKSDGSALLQNISLTVYAGEITALIGKSGSGKSILVKTLLDVLPKGVQLNSGCFRMDNQQYLKYMPKERKAFIGQQFGIVLQDSQNSFDPLRTIEGHFVDVLRSVKRYSKQFIRQRAKEMCLLVQLDEDVLSKYPFELSGGMRQRVQIALALVHDPPILIADEPTTALDAIVQLDILLLLKQISKTTGKGMLFITHDLTVVQKMADSIYVMNDGQVVDNGTFSQIKNHPNHSFTKQLFKNDHLYLPTGMNSSAEPLVSASDLSVSFSSKRWFRTDYKRAVQNVSLNIHKGEIVGLIGESGSGKSTLASAILQQIEVEEGNVKFFDCTVRDVQWVQQNAQGSFNPNWSVEQIISEGLSIRGLSKEQQKVQARTILQEVGLSEELLKVHPSKCSGGMQQRIAIARALLLQPKLLILDEPFASLDMTSQVEMIQLLQSLHRHTNMAMLFISHDLRRTLSFCHTINVMKSGEIIDQGTVQQITQSQHSYTEKLLEAAFLTENGEILCQKTS